MGKTENMTMLTGESRTKIVDSERDVDHQLS
jgi:hypothetical protein